MTLPASGVIYLSQVDTELSRTATAAIDMNESAVRTLFGVSSGTIYMSNGYGKSNAGPPVTITISANVTNFNAYNNRSASQHGTAVTVTGGPYATGSTVTVVVNSGVYVGSTSNATYSFDTGTGWNAADIINVTNNGYILGIGGAGDSGAGGPALRAQCAVTVTNNGTIGGGGGGGGVGQWVYANGNTGYSAGGAGGSGGQGYPGGVAGAPQGYVAGSAGGSGGRPLYGNDNQQAGYAGSVTAPGALNPYCGLCYVYYTNSGYFYGGYGGAGGALGQPGTAGTAGYKQSAVASITQWAAAGAGGAAGACTNGNANITWAVAGIRAGTLG
jgi:hypothetical protein